jgi:acrylyl-CoA reductase (NADPH)
MHKGFLDHSLPSIQWLGFVATSINAMLKRSSHENYLERKAMDSFRAYVLDKTAEGLRGEIQTLANASLPEGNVTLKVHYSSLNYKDALAITGKAQIIRDFPMIPGIDLAGVVTASSDDRYHVGQHVLATGWHLGERIHGGYSELNRLKADYLVPLPQGLNLEEAMAFGTAGFTAMLCVMRLEEAGLTPAVPLPILVTGASGGVGSFAVAMLSSLGYAVTAVTGRDTMHDYLRSLGAREILPRQEMAATPRPLEGRRWSAVIDTVGSDILARALAEMDDHGLVAATGLAAGAELSTTVLPFILRNVSLLGVDSVSVPFERRQQAWARMAQLDKTNLARIYQIESWEHLSHLAQQLLAGQRRGRVVIKIA